MRKSRDNDPFPVRRSARTGMHVVREKTIDPRRIPGQIRANAQRKSRLRKPSMPKLRFTDD